MKKADLRKVISLFHEEATLFTFCYDVDGGSYARLN